MKRTVLGFLSALIVLAVATPTLAVKWVSGEELIGHCKAYNDAPTSLDGIVCVAYVQGFLGGAEATDPAVEENVRAQYPQPTDFMERVVRTRLGRQVEQFGATALAGYCLPVAEPVTQVVFNIVTFIDGHPESASMTAQEIVYGALKQYYPCQ